MTTARVLVSIPTYGGLDFRTFEALSSASRKGAVAGVQYVKSSFLTKCFNQLWCRALNARESQGLTHFAMLHGDVVPMSLWLDHMLEIASETNADVLSVVMPMKSEHGVTSTAIESADRMKPTRFTLKQLDKMPVTFTHEKLLVNTGLMLVKLAGDWIEKIHFHFEDEIRIEDGIRVAHALSEDWAFSMDARALGAKVYATRAVTAVHLGEWAYPNSGAWGKWEWDMANGEAKLNEVEGTP
jgi:hypothetical protein